MSEKTDNISCIENLPFPRLMLADDAGLGKTAEAGLILFRLMQRRRAERVLILTRARPGKAN